MDRHRRDRHGNGGYEDSHHRGHPRNPPRFSEGDEAFNRRRRRGNSPSSYQIGGGRRWEDDSPTDRDLPVQGNFRPMNVPSGRVDFPRRPMGYAFDGGFRPIAGVGGGRGGFRPNGPVKFPSPEKLDGGRFISDSVRLPPPPPLPPVQQRLSGQKRGLPLSEHDASDRSSVVKLFMGSVPRTAIEEEVRPFFERHGNVLEVALIKDKKTGQQQGCCFVKYATSEDADRAIRALHNQITLPGGTGPVQVRYADGERERIGALEFKLFVGALNKQATEKEVEEIFVQFGRVEDVYLMRDEYKQSRGCGFVKYSSKETAMAAINGLNGTYTMRGCNQPLIVRFADPKRPKPGESKDVAPLAGLGPGTRFQASGPRPTSNLGGSSADVSHTNSWRPTKSPTVGPPSNTGIRGRSEFSPRLSQATMPSNQGGPLGGCGVPPLNPVPVSGVSSSATSQQQNRATGQQVSPLEKPLPSPQNIPLRPPQVNFHGAHASSQNPYGYSSQLPTSQLLSQQNATPTTAPQTPLNINLRPTHVSSATNQFPPHAQQPPLQKMQHPPSELAQLLSQQTQTLQATFQSSQQAFSQLQQELQSRQQPNQHLPASQNGQAGKQQSVASVKCNWTEHTSPDGFKYYYNGLTGESKWEKPEEMIEFERQQQYQQKPTPSQPMQQQPQQAHQQYQGHQQLQQPFYPSLYPTPGVNQNAQYPSLAVSQNTQFAMSGIGPNGQEYGRTHITSTDDPSRAQQEPVWKSKTSGT